MANATIYDVAGLAKVSLATVSRVMNNPDKVNAKTREKVLNAIKELGYRPNAIARGLASRKSTTIAVLTSDVTRQSISMMLGGICDIAYQYDYSIKIFSSQNNIEFEELVRNAIASQVDGILFLNEEIEEELAKKLLKLLSDNSIPVILTNVRYKETKLPYVIIDYEKATYQITKMMIEKGRKNIYLISTNTHYFTNELKEKGYILAMEEEGLKPNIFRTSGDVDINKEEFNKFIDNNKVDGVISVRDSIAVSFMNVCFKKGINIPNDISVCGLQNTKYAKLSNPNLTCLDTPVYAIGAVAMRLLTKLMKNEKIDSSSIVLPHNIIKRESL